MEASYSRTMCSIILEKMLGKSFRNTTNLLTSQSDRASAGCARRSRSMQVTLFNLRDLKDPLAVLEYQTPRDVSCSFPSPQTSFGSSRGTSRILLWCLMLWLINVYPHYTEDETFFDTKRSWKEKKCYFMSLPTVIIRLAGLESDWI